MDLKALSAELRAKKSENAKKLSKYIDEYLSYVEKSEGFYSETIEKLIKDTAVHGAAVHATEYNLEKLRYLLDAFKKWSVCIQKINKNLKSKWQDFLQNLHEYILTIEIYQTTSKEVAHELLSQFKVLLTGEDKEIEEIRTERYSFPDPSLTWVSYGNKILDLFRKYRDYMISRSMSCKNIEEMLYDVLKKATEEKSLHKHMKNIEETLHEFSNLAIEKQNMTR